MGIDLKAKITMSNVKSSLAWQAKYMRERKTKENKFSLFFTQVC